MRSASDSPRVGFAPTTTTVATLTAPPTTVSSTVVPPTADVHPPITTSKSSAPTSVGGRNVVQHTTHTVRIHGRDVDVLLPQGTSLQSYLGGLRASGAFASQHDALDALEALPTSLSTNSNRRPVIGIVLSEPKMLVPGAHKNTEVLLRCVESLGCRAVLIPPCADIAVRGGPKARERVVASMAAQLDGLLGPGGADVDPSVYGETNTHALHTNPMRDQFEAAFVRVALDCELFAFGICRSHQLWNAAAGGSLIQDVEHEGAASISHRHGHHSIFIEHGSMMFEAVRQRALMVNSLHHQAVDLEGWGFRVVARAVDPHSGKPMIEATERWNGITTQYHPELMDNDPTQRALLDTLGRRAHAFAALKQMPAKSLRGWLDLMKADRRYNADDLAWASRDVGRRLPS
jgi:putative glutamine amidotransferase